MRFHAVLALMKFFNEMTCWLLQNFLTNFRTRYPDVMSCFWGSLRAFRMRFHACLAVMRWFDEIACCLAAEFSC